MSSTPTSHEPVAGDLHEAGGHDDDSHDDHGHGEEELGPVDVLAWGALALGVAAGLVIVLCLVLTTSILS